MSGYNKFLDHVYSDELIPDHIDDIDEVNRLMTDEGYEDCSQELEQELVEQEAWRGSKEFSGILIKKACEHPTCPHFKCERSVRIGGIEI